MGCYLEYVMVMILRIIFMQVFDEEKELVDQRPVDAKIWPHDASVTNIYLCTNCRSMRATWNQA